MRSLSLVVIGLTLAATTAAAEPLRLADTDLDRVTADVRSISVVALVFQGADDDGLDTDDTIGRNCSTSGGDSGSIDPRRSADPGTTMPLSPLRPALRASAAIRATRPAPALPCPRATATWPALALRSSTAAPLPATTGRQRQEAPRARRSWSAPAARAIVPSANPAAPLRARAARSPRAASPAVVPASKPPASSPAMATPACRPAGSPLVASMRRRLLVDPSPACWAAASTEPRATDVTSPAALPRNLIEGLS